MPKNEMPGTPKPKAKPLDPPQFNTKTLIDVRGWTKTGIKEFLGAPDRIERRHSDNVGDYVVYWYLTTSVVAAEATLAFKAFQEKKAARSEAAQKGVRTKYEETMDFVHKLDIQVPQLDRETLVRRACDFYNARRQRARPRPCERLRRQRSGVLGLHHGRLHSPGSDWLRSRAARAVRQGGSGGRRRGNSEQGLRRHCRGVSRSRKGMQQDARRTRRMEEMRTEQ